MNFEKDDFIIPIDVKKLTELKISIEDFVILYLLAEGERYIAKEYLKAASKDIPYFMLRLLKTGLVEKINESSSIIGVSNIKPSQAFRELFSNYSSHEDVEKWIDEWYELWPVGIKSGGYYLRSDKAGSKRKLKKFLESHPHYTKEVVLEATKNYLNEQSIKGYQYTKLAPYFIGKDGLSVLAGECEHLLETGEVSDGISSIEEYGAGEL